MEKEQEEAEAEREERVEQEGMEVEVEAVQRAGRWPLLVSSSDRRWDQGLETGWSFLNGVVYKSTRCEHPRMKHLRGRVRMCGCVCGKGCTTHCHQPTGSQVLSSSGK